MPKPNPDYHPDQWRNVCARCGSHCVRQTASGNFRCDGHRDDHTTTPVVWDKFAERWVGISHDDRETTAVGVSEKSNIQGGYGEESYMGTWTAPDVAPDP